MRHQIQEAPITRLLLQKAAPYAELDENARIAVSVLHQDGWHISRVESKVQIEVSMLSEPIAFLDATVEAERKLQELRAHVVRAQARFKVEVAAACAIAFTVSAVLAELRVPYIGVLLAVGSLLAAVVQLIRNRKGGR